MKLPNGYGSVVKMSGRRRKPYVVRKTAGWEYDPKKDKMIQKYTIIGYAETKKEGLRMLSEYNENPYDITSKKITFQAIYELWSKDKYKTLSKQAISNYKAVYASCEPLYNRPFASLKLHDLQTIIDTCGKNYPSLVFLKTLFNQMYIYAIKNEICGKNYAEYVDVLKHKNKNPNKRPRNRIPENDVKKIWEYSSDPYYQIILMLIYNGCRISEFLNLKKTEVHLTEQYFEIIDAKTENGIRCVPIADRMLPFYQEWYDRYPECEYLISAPDGVHFTYHNYYSWYFLKLVANLGIQCTPHSTRHTTTSMMADAEISPTIQKKILGHAGAMSITERVYTHPDIRTLIDAVNKICIVPA